MTNKECNQQYTITASLIKKLYGACVEQFEYDVVASLIDRLALEWECVECHRRNYYKKKRCTCGARKKNDKG